MNIAKKIELFEKRVQLLEEKENKRTRGLKCDHQTIPWGVHKRKCGKCGEIFIVGD